MRSASAIGQRSAPDEGVYFKREWFNWYDQPPLHLTTYGASDYAVKGKSGDWTVHVVAGVDPEDNLYILDLWRKQTTSDVWIDAFLDLVDQHKPMVWAEEDGQIIKSLGPFIEKRCSERNVPTERVKTIDDYHTMQGFSYLDDGLEGEDT